MSKIIQILTYEEGYKDRPYIDTEGYPTVACGIVIGPKTLRWLIINLPCQKRWAIFGCKKCWMTKFS